MAKFILMLILLSVAPGAQLHAAQSTIKQDGNTIILDRGNNHVEFTKEFEINGGEFRVFGINVNPQPNSPIGYIDVMIGMITLSRDKALFKQSGPQQCEALAAKEMKTFSVLFADDAIKNQILSYRDKPMQGHFALKITGTMIKKTVDMYRGQSMEGMTASGAMDINSVILLTKADIVQW